MKEKFREFFEKHQHLVVLSLIIAVILAALTPLVVPLGLKLDEKINIPPRLFAWQYDDADVLCYQHEEGGCRAIYTESTLGELCRAINRAPDERDPLDVNVKELCSFYFNGSNHAATYRLTVGAGQYKLTTVKNTNRFTWFVSEQTAEELLRYCWCAEDPAVGNPRRVFTDPERLQSVSLRVYQKGELQEEITLTETQIASLCAQVDALFDSVRYSNILESKNNPWQFGTTSSWQFKEKDGTRWQLQYSHGSGSLRLCCLSDPISKFTPDQFRVHIYQLPMDIDPAILNAILEP